MPLLSCSVQLVANGGSRQRTACSNGTVASPIVFYSSVRLADLLLQWDVSYSGPTPAPTAPAYVQPAGYSVGVISTQAYGALSRASGTVFDGAAGGTSLNPDFHPQNGPVHDISMDQVVFKP